MPKLLLTNEVIQTGLWKLLETNPSYSVDTTTKATVGKNPACTYFRFIPGTTQTAASNFPPYFSRISALTLSTGEDYVFALTVSGNYLYAGLLTTPGKIVKIDLTTFTKVSTLTLASNEGPVYRLIVIGNYLYAGLGTAPGKIVKIALTTFTKVSTLTLEWGENFVYDFAVVGNYLYAGLGTTPGKIVKIDLTTFTRVSTLTLDTGEHYVRALIVIENYLYAGITTTPGRITKIDLTTFTRVSTLALATEEDNLFSMAASGGCIYAGLYETPGVIVKTGFEPYGWRTEKPLTGIMNAGVWTFKIKLVNDTKYSFSVRVAVRLTKYTHPLATVELGTIISPNVLTLPASAGGAVTDTWTWSAPAITFNNEYLLAEYRIHIVTASSSSTARCSFVCDQNPAEADISITTPQITMPISIIAQSFPMYYLSRPIKAQELISKVEGATITHVSSELPEKLIRKGKANELRSKFE